jgi:hypothetical protein
MQHITMAEEFELRRSPCAEVSQAIAAIDDDGARFVEHALRIAHHFRQWKMNRALDRRASMLMLGKHVDHLPPSGEDLQHLAMIGSPHTPILFERGSPQYPDAAPVPRCTHRLTV